MNTSIRKPILSVRELSKSFTLHAIDRTVASLRAVSFDLMPGEHLALAGASGAGKSSLLRCIYRNYLPDSGTVVLHDGERDVELTALDDRAMARIRGRDFGYVSQFLNAPPRQGPLKLVAAAARRRGLDDAVATEAAALALRRLGIEERLWDVDCSVLSGGERQRVNLAAGTVSPPRLLLLDEPVSALDPANRVLALEVIEDLRHRDVSVLAVYHDMKIIRRVANRVLYMEDGAIVADGGVDEVLDAGHRVLDEVYA
ncbi:ATP-binding cassette domain-containing protein [Microbacterium sp. A82]|uniref:ATP-binding cassette domain-containing protein n=1 Tax=unclassified Microbacterium TaxID=2609290 RepID=UPI003F2F4EC7